MVTFNRIIVERHFIPEVFSSVWGTYHISKPLHFLFIIFKYLLILHMHWKIKMESMDLLNHNSCQLIIFYTHNV